MNNQIELTKLLLKLKRNEEVTPSAAFRTNARIRVLNSVAQAPSIRVHTYPGPFTYAFRLAGIVAFLSATSLVYAAQTSQPNEALYPVKVLSERVALTLSPTQPAKTAVANTIIGRRIEEIQRAQKDGNEKTLTQTIDSFDRDVAEIEKTKDISHDAINQTLTKHKTFIKELHRKERKHEQKDTNQSGYKKTEEKQNEHSGAPQPTQTPTPLELLNPTSIPVHEDLKIAVPKEREDELHIDK